MELRQYSLAYDLLKGASRLQSANEVQARMDILLKMKRYDTNLYPENDPRYPVARAIVEAYSANPSLDRLKPLFTKREDWTSLQQAFSRNWRNSVAARNRLISAGLSQENILDIAVSILEIKNPGGADLGHRVSGNSSLGPLPVIGQLFTGPPIGIGMLTAGIVLGIMIIPFIAAVTRDVFNSVPAPLKESAVALGSTRWEILTRVSLPYTRSAVIGAIFLGLGRALGETMAVTFVLGNSHELTKSLLMPSNSIAAAIANEFTEADSDIYVSSLIALAFLLFVVTVIVLALARLMLARLNKMQGRTR